MNIIKASELFFCAMCVMCFVLCLYTFVHIYIFHFILDIILHLVSYCIIYLYDCAFVTVIIKGYLTWLWVSLIAGGDGWYENTRSDRHTTANFIQRNAKNRSAQYTPRIRQSPIPFVEQELRRRTIKFATSRLKPRRVRFSQSEEEGQLS